MQPASAFLSLHFDSRNRALVACERGVDGGVVALDCSDALYRYAGIFGKDRDSLSFALECHRAVHALLVAFLPRLPAFKIVVLADQKLCFGIVARLPVFAVKSYEREFAAVGAVAFFVGGIEQGYERAVPYQARRRKAF